jgi:hypothetical protein
MMQGLVIGIVGSVLGAAGGSFLTWLLDRYQFIRFRATSTSSTGLPVAFDPGGDRASSWSGASGADLVPGDALPGAAGGAADPVEAIRHE